MAIETPRIALISAVSAAIPPASAALNTALPSSDLWNLLDDRLLTDADRAGGLTPALEDRMRRLIDHALTEGADAVLLTCSLYGAVAQDYSSSVPVLAPDEAAFALIAASGFGTVLVIASFDGARDDSRARLDAALGESGAATRLVGATSPDAMAATKRGDLVALEKALIATATGYDGLFDAVFLAQYSLAPAAEALTAALGRPVVTGPAAAAAAIKTRLQH